ncbi:MAG: prepilin-type N-terminal cleavage/methylation domain-containing protein [Psychrilyobacter sp.]|uniref:pilus assembly FimT family protein n=1 Tax=Psychrilyobacter sp. TaxID=2586924 RepID=UPI003C72F3A8
MKKRGFTIIELLIVLALIGILVGIGGVSIKKQAESRAMIKVTNEIGDFFRIAAKRSRETGEKYTVHFNLVEKKIEIYREEEEENGVANGKWKDGGIKVPIERLDLPNIFEYEKISESSFDQDFTSKITSTGNMSGTITLYVFKSNSQLGIQGDEIAKYSIRLLTTDKHVKFLHVKEYTPKTKIKRSEIEGGTRGASNTSDWEITRE